MIRRRYLLDHLVFVGLYRLFPKICDALAIVKPDTIVRWLPSNLGGIAPTGDWHDP
jgi:hypothetical protein